MKEKTIVFLLTMNITMGIYILRLPTRSSFAPGGELFIPLWVFTIWLLGSLIKEEMNEERNVDNGR